jgi:hypothetical protein
MVAESANFCRRFASLSGEINKIGGTSVLRADTLKRSALKKEGRLLQPAFT